MKLKVGDKVKLKNRRGKEWNRNGKMDKYIGKIVTVSNITLGNGFTIKEDDGRGFPRWVFRLEDIEYVDDDSAEVVEESSETATEN